MADDAEQAVRDFMIQNMLAKFADAVAGDGWLLDELATLSPTELQEVVDDAKMKKGHARRFKLAVAKLSSAAKCKGPHTEDLLISSR